MSRTPRSCTQLLEKLYRERWNKYDGLGGLVITPTRELALQIFQQLRRVGARHDFSAGLLIGGKDVKEEVGRVNGRCGVFSGFWWLRVCVLGVFVCFCHSALWCFCVLATHIEECAYVVCVLACA